MALPFLLFSLSVKSNGESNFRNLAFACSLIVNITNAMMWKGFNSRICDSDAMVTRDWTDSKSSGKLEVFWRQRKKRRSWRKYYRGSHQFNSNKLIVFTLPFCFLLHWLHFFKLFNHMWVPTRKHLLPTVHQVEPTLLLVFLPDTEPQFNNQRNSRTIDIQIHFIAIRCSTKFSSQFQFNFRMQQLKQTSLWHNNCLIPIAYQQSSSIHPSIHLRTNNSSPNQVTRERFWLKWKCIFRNPSLPLLRWSTTTRRYARPRDERHRSQFKVTEGLLLFLLLITAMNIYPIKKAVEEDEWRYHWFTADS